MAVAASMLQATYFMLRDGVEYRDLGSDHFDRRDKSKAVPFFEEQGIPLSRVLTDRVGGDLLVEGVEAGTFLIGLASVNGPVRTDESTGSIAVLPASGCLLAQDFHCAIGWGRHGSFWCGWWFSLS